MKTIRKVEITPVYVEFIPEVLEEGKMYISKEYGIAVHNCLCGCGGKTPLPLNDEKFPNHGWNLIEHEDGRISFTPSILNNCYPCKAHYIITKNVANLI